MTRKESYSIWDKSIGSVLFLVFMFVTQPVRAISVEELASICEALESAIYDMHVEYEWRVYPPTPFEEIEGTNEIIKDELSKCQWTSARPFAARSLAVESSEYRNGHGVSWHGVTKNSYNGRVSKHLQIHDPCDSSHRDLDGTITKDMRLVTHSNITPQGFTILRFHEWPISNRMRGDEKVVIDETIQKVNGFNTIRADFVHPASTDKTPSLSIYFSTDHDYTPVRFEFPNFSGFVDVSELVKVSDGLWFPKSGRIHDKSEEGNIYKATKIVVNQGLTEEHFDIKFPYGTSVHDEIVGLEYAIKPVEEQLDQWLSKEESIEPELQKLVATSEKSSVSDSNIEAVPEGATEQHAMFQGDSMAGKRSLLSVFCHIIAVLLLVASALMLRKALIKEGNSA